MMDMPEKFLLLAILLAVAYPLVMRLLLEWAQPAHLELLETRQSREVYARLSEDEDFQRLVDLEIRSSIVANPIAATVIFIEISAVLLVGLIFGTGMDFARKLFIDFLTRNLPNAPAPATNRGR